MRTSVASQRDQWTLQNKEETSLFPGSSALRTSTPGLKSDDPSGAVPPAGSTQAGWHTGKGVYCFDRMSRDAANRISAAGAYHSVEFWS